MLAINGTFPSWAANGSGLAGQVKGKRKVRLMDGGRKHVEGEHVGPIQCRRGRGIHGRRVTCWGTTY